ncbi:hypothetical protein D9M71_751800 [compost metagenome]
MTQLVEARRTASPALDEPAKLRIVAVGHIQGIKVSSPAAHGCIGVYELTGLRAGRLGIFQDLAVTIGIVYPESYRVIHSIRARRLRCGICVLLQLFDVFQ